MATQVVLQNETDRWRRIGAGALVTAGLLILTSAAFPVPDDPADHARFVTLLVANVELTKVIMVAVPAGIWALAVGVVALHRRAAPGATEAWLQLGRHAVLVGAAVVTVQFALGTAALAEATRGAFDTGIVLWAAATYVRLFAMLAVWAGVIAVGVGLLTDRMYSYLLSWPAILPGAGVVIASATAIFTGPTSVAAKASGALAGLTAIWSILLGITLIRNRA